MNPSANAQAVEGSLESTEAAPSIPPASRTRIGSLIPRDAISVHADLEIDQLEEILLDEDLAEAPVVDEEGKVVGMVAAVDVVRDIHDHGDTSQDEPGGDLRALGFGFHEPAPRRTVRDIMRAPPAEIADQMSVAEAAAVMAAQGTHRLAVTGESGRLLGIVTSLDVLRWLTERGKTGSLLDEPGVPVLEAGRLVAVASLAGGLAHQVNNALTHGRLSLGRLISLELAQRPRTPVSSHRIELLQDVRESYTRIERMLGELRALARIEASSTGVADVSAILVAVVRVISHEVRHRARLTLRGSKTPLARGNAGSLSQLFVTLLLHAAEAVPEGRASENEIQVTIRTDDRARIVVEIMDTGEPVPGEALSHLFEPRTAPDDRTARPGLWVCGQIMRTLGGEITARANDAGGTTVRIVIPSVESHGPPSLSPEQGSDQRPRRREGQRRVLVVDDDRPVAAALALTLDKHDVIVAQSGKEALAILERDPGVDVVLCDLMMPEMTGMDLFEKARELDETLPSRFVFMTGGAFTSRAQSFLSSVDNVRLDKPFTADAVNRLVESMPQAERAPPPSSRAGDAGGKGRG